MAMAAAIGIGISIGLASTKRCFPIRPPFIYCIARLPHISSVSAVEAPKAESHAPVPQPTKSLAKKNEGVSGKAADWKKLNSKELGITSSMIDKHTRYVLKTLRKKGYQVYLVGGCVRDLILKRIPKDFDIITSAELKEVSSFSTVAKKSKRNFNKLSKKPRGCGEDDYIRWKNCIQRDFTINGLMFDPYSKIVYDYIGGIEDIKRSRVRTVTPAFSSFTEDCARILRAFRIAARLEFKFTKEMALSLKELSFSVLRLDRGRILMEMNYMLAYGSAEASLRLLWKYGLLEILLPLQAAYFVSQGFRRRDKRVSLLAFHKALADQPRDPLVIAAFCLAIHNGGALSEAVSIAKSNSRSYDSSFHELLECQDNNINENLINDVKDLAASVKTALCQLTDETIVSQAMAKYPQAPFSDLVFISLALQLRTDKIISCITKGRESGFVPKHGSHINYDSLAIGNLHEVRCMLSRIIFDTIYPPYLNKNDEQVNEKFT
ncbi:Poly(A) polymerase I [Bienertia sinuspersici]